MTRRSSILASDADRERVAERLRQAATEGRILAHELEDRVARALRARTYGELDGLVADLPRSGSGAADRRRSTALTLARSHPLAAVVVLVMLTLMICIAAAVMAFSGVWVLFLIVGFARLGPWSRGPRGRGRYVGPGHGASRYGGTRRERSAYWVR